jgi:cytochrome c553
MTTHIVTRSLLPLALLTLVAVIVWQAPTEAQPPTTKTPAPDFVPKFEAIADTKLLMEGLTNTNYRSLNKLLKTRPTDAETWSFVRGQSMLIAETGNLLLLRPPRNAGRDTWMKLAMEMRSQAAELSKQATAKDYLKSRTAFNNMTTSCNRCHQTFRVPVKIAPAPEPGERDT